MCIRDREDIGLKVEIETISPTRKRFKVELPREEISSQVEKICAELRKQVTIPGFRKGRAPNWLIIARFEDHIKGKLIEKNGKIQLIDHNNWKKQDKIQKNSSKYSLIVIPEIEKANSISTLLKILYRNINPRILRYNPNIFDNKEEGYKELAEQISALYKV